MPGSFLDTNVLIYTASADARKADRAEELLSAGGMISVQVLNEVVNVARRKMKLPWPEVHKLLERFRRLMDVSAVTIRTHEVGIELCERYELAVYDAMIVAAAIEQGCDTLWSEDMHDGLVVENRLVLKNPFVWQ